MRRLVSFIIVIFSIVQIGIAQNFDEIAKNADIYTQDGKTQKAIDKFELLGDHGSADIYYNLGRLYQEQNDIAHAALNYERAIKIDRNHDQATNNLNIIREETDFDIIAVEEMFLIRWWKGIAGTLGANAWMFLSLIIALTLVAAIYFWWIANRKYLKKNAFLASAILPVVLGVVLALGYTSKSITTNNDFAIIIDADFDIHEGADDRSPIVKDIEAGTKVEVVDQIDDWIKVVTADTESGWVKADEIERI